MFKISLPNPNEVTVPEFLKQMKIALKSIELSYNEMVKGKFLNGDNTPWIEFVHEEKLEVFSETIDVNEYDSMQVISLEIDSL